MLLLVLYLNVYFIQCRVNPMPHAMCTQQAPHDEQLLSAMQRLERETGRESIAYDRNRDCQARQLRGASTRKRCRRQTPRQPPCNCSSFPKVQSELSRVQPGTMYDIIRPALAEHTFHPAVIHPPDASWSCSSLRADLLDT